MNITFLIGNGFDINLGLKTQYISFYPYFIKQASENNMIKNWINENERLWSDLEEKLGQELKNVSEDNLEKFYDDMEEMNRLLIQYLENEQKSYIIEDSELIMKEFTRSMLQFFYGLPLNDVNSIRNTMNSYRSQEFIYSFITFNYTDVLDRIIDLYENSKTIATHQYAGNVYGNNIGNVLHIHGTTEAEMILGVNDKTQIENDYLKSDTSFLDTIIKERMNNSIGQRKTEKGIKIIDDSHIMCIFGMSIGNTDKMWWEKIINWLKGNGDNKLIIFVKGFEEELKKKIPARTIRLNEKIKRDIFSKGKGNNDDSLYEKIKDRMMISYNANIFNLKQNKDI